MNEFIIIKTTFPKQEPANLLANLLIKEKLAFCVQIQKIESIYNFQEKTQEDSEFLLEIKSVKQNYNKITDEILKNHPYETAQIFSIKIDEIEKSYEKWALNSLIIA
jgi:periplasmic divalent cation tolerance protein